VVSNPQKIKGDRFERELRDHATVSGVPTERTKAGYARDAGDVHFYATPARPPLAIGQCKATPKFYDLAGFVRDAEAQRLEARATWAAAIVKRKGVTAPGEQFVVLTYDTWLSVLAAAAGVAALPEEIAS
jgi:DNA-binding transcriptional LysR family regulator